MSLKALRRAKTQAFQDLRVADRRRLEASELLDLAYAAERQAWQVKKDAAQALQEIRGRNNPLIEELRIQRDSLFQQMGEAYEKAKKATVKARRAEAKTHSLRGNELKGEGERCALRMRPLIQEIRDAVAAHDAATLAFREALRDFEQAKALHDAFRAKYEAALEKYKQARDALDQAEADS